MVARHCIIKGRVQGVGFRYFTYRAAEEHGIRGWVKNLPGGEVETYAAGDGDAMTRFLNELQRGPSSATVEHVEVRDVELESYSTFSIER